MAGMVFREMKWKLRRLLTGERSIMRKGCWFVVKQSILMEGWDDSVVETGG